MANTTEVAVASNFARVWKGMADPERKGREAGHSTSRRLLSGTSTEPAD